VMVGLFGILQRVCHPVQAPPRCSLDSGKYQCTEKPLGGDVRYPVSHRADAVASVPARGPDVEVLATSVAAVPPLGLCPKDVG
jgi:hypothetical protein